MNVFFKHKKRVIISSVFNIDNVHQGKPDFDSIALAPLSGAVPTACLPLMQKNRKSYPEGPCKPFCLSLCLMLISSPFKKNSVIVNSKQQVIATYSSLFRRKSLENSLGCKMSKDHLHIWLLCHWYEKGVNWKKK